MQFCLVGAPRTEPWSVEKAAAWHVAQPWMAGANYAPATAINQLEMWQADTFDPKQIDRELGWAQGLGFTTMRVFLHDIPWREDPLGFLDRIDHFLKICDSHKIRVMFVFFDGVWNPYPKAGTQSPPKPHVHNSGWVQSPGVDKLTNPAAYDGLEAYVKAVLTRFRDDPRVVVWDLFNEPNNPNSGSYAAVETPDKAEYALILLRKAFQWAREVNPSQPLTAGVWEGNWDASAQMSAINKFMLGNSDVISFHNYHDLDNLTKRVATLRTYGRPLLCTEYMARPNGSRFQGVMGYMKEQGIAAYNWGFVSGKSQTIYPWDSWRKTYTDEPTEWFHDIFRTDGTPYKHDEVDFIKKTCLEK